MLRTLSGATAIVFASVVASPALAQTAPVSDDHQAVLEEVLVTAQYRSESSQRAAMALDVVSPGALENAGVNSSIALNAAVPGLYVSRGGGAMTSYFIRGVGNFTNNGYTDPAVAFNVDGVYVGRPGSTIGAFQDLERIEVLKGPQGTLYGRNATGGAINVIPAKPVLGQFSGHVGLGVGNYSAVDGDAFINLPIGAANAVRLSGRFVTRNGYNSDGTNDEKGSALRAQWLSNVTDNLTVRVSGDYSHVGGVGPGGSYTQSINITPGTAATATSPANYTVVATGLDPRSGLASATGAAFYAGRVLGGPRINPGPLSYPFMDNDYYGANAEIGWKTGIGTITVIPAYRKAKNQYLFNGPAFRGGLIHEDSDQTSLEARLAGNRVGPVDWLVGAFYFNENVNGIQNFSQYTVNAFQAFDSNNKSSAAYGRLTFNVSDTLRLVGGLRYTKEKKSFVGDGRNLIEICTNPTGCIGGPSVPVALTFADLSRQITLPTLPGPPNSVAFGTAGNRLFYAPISINQQLDRNKTTWRAAVEYDIAPQSLLYVSYETGFRTGGFNFSLGHESYEPEEIKAWTIGSKNRFFDDRLQLNVEAYRWNYTNQQVAHFGLDATGGNSYFTENIGRSRIQGVDIDLRFRATQNTLLHGAVEFLDNKLTSFVYSTIRDTAANFIPPPVGCATSPGVAPIPGSTTGATGTVWIIDCSGKSGYNSPKVAANAGVEQTFPLGDYSLVATLDGRYRSDRVTSFDYLPFQNSGSDFIADAALRLTRSTGKWSLTAYVQNIGDKLVPVLATFAGTTGSVVVSNYSPPRTFGVRGGINY